MIPRPPAAAWPADLERAGILAGGMPALTYRRPGTES
jgi:hypothetical protein